MSDKRAVVLLHPVAFSDDLPCRSLTFNSESDHVNIGRASKRENKNLAPARNNALFDSRVMSRTHAILSVSIENRLVYIRDPGSMHGTWLNREKIPIDKDITLSSGDVLTFGVEVVRGSETFPPLAVRCECQWFLTPDMESQKQYRTSNTFCVPDDDDDDCCEITAQNSVPLHLTVDRSSESKASSVGSDSDDSRSVIEVSSPLTSPLKGDDIPDVVECTNDSPENLEPRNERREKSQQPLATPRMTPSSPEFDSEDSSGENQYYDEYFAHGSDKDSDIEPDWELDGEEDDKSDVDDSRPEPFECERDAHVLNDQSDGDPDLIQPSTETGNVETDDSFGNSLHPHQREVPQWVNDFSEHTPSTCQNDPPALDTPVAATKVSDSEPQLPGQSVPEAPWSAKLPPLHCSLSKLAPNAETSFQPSVKTSDHYPNILNPPYVPLPLSVEKTHLIPRYSFDTMPSQSPYTSDAPYNDGPFATSQPIPGTGPAHITTRGGSSKPEFMPFMDPLAPMIPRTSCDANVNSNTTKLLPFNDWTALNAKSEPIPLRKRKATEMESDSVENDHTAVTIATPAHSHLNIDESMEGQNEGADLPDAQPQSLAAILNSSGSQLTTLSIPESPKEDERPTKRVKATSHMRSFRSHATTAVLGAVVGAIGTIAALASLPPDYFA